MTKTEIINIWAHEKVVENIIKKFTISAPKDLAQQLYLELLEKDDDVIIELYNKNQYNFYIARMVLNNIKSLKSPYYRTYERYTTSAYVSLNEAIMKADEVKISNEDFEVAWSKLTDLEQRILLMHIERNREDIILTLKQEYDKDTDLYLANRYIDYCKYKLKCYLTNQKPSPFKRNRRNETPVQKKERQERIKKKLKPIYCFNVVRNKVKMYNNVYDAEKSTKVQKQVIWNKCKNHTSYKNKYYFSYDGNF